MFRDDDPGLAQLREIALALPEAFERVSLGRPVFCAPKMFALCGGSIKQADGPQTPHPHSVLLKVDDSERPALQRDPRFFYPAYLGPYGWLGLDFSAAALDWNEVGELVDGGCPEFRGASLFGAQGSIKHRPHPGGLFKVVGGADNRLARGLNKSVELTGEVARLGLVAGHRPYRCQISGAGLGSADRTQNTGSVDTVGVPEPGGGKWFLGFFASGGVDGGSRRTRTLIRRRRSGGYEKPAVEEPVGLLA
jgi:hypothetical protein